MSQVDTENTMESPQQHLENVNTPREIDQAPLNSPAISVSSIISISDSDDENNFECGDENNFDGGDENNFDGGEENHFIYGDVIVIDSDDEKNDNEENEINRKSLDRYNRRLKYKMRRAINILLRYNIHLSEDDILFLETKKNEMRCEKSNRVVGNKSEQPLSEKQIIRGLKTLRRRYIEAIRASYEIIEIWLSHNVSDCDALNTGCMQWASPFILSDDYVPVARGLHGEVQPNDLDFLIQDIDFSDSESSSCESEISSGENEDTSDIYFDNGEFHQHPSVDPYYMNDNITPNSSNQDAMHQQQSSDQNIMHQQQSQRRNQRLQRRNHRLKRRQQLRRRLKISQLEPGSSAGPDDVCVSDVQKRNQPSPRIYTITLDDQESCINDDLPCRRNSRRIVETNSLSSETATLSSHAITNNLLTTPVMRVQRRSRSRTRNHSRSRRFCSVSPPSSRAHIISQEQMRGRSRSPLNVQRSPTPPLVPTIPRLSPSKLPRSPSTDTTTATDIGASTVTTTTAGRPDLSQSPPEALGSTLQRALTDDDDGGASATLSQVAHSLLELSEQ